MHQPEGREMSATQPFETTIRMSRIVRVGLDIVLFVALLGLFIQLKLLSDSYDSNIKGKQHLANALGNTKSRSSEIKSVEHLEEFHDSETSMWTSFFQWQSKTNHATGSCMFMPPDAQQPGKFHLFCIGENAQPSVVLNAEPMQVLVAKKDAQANWKPETQQTNKSEDFAVQPAIASGWLDTPTGRMHFDPIAKRWKP